MGGRLAVTAAVLSLTIFLLMSCSNTSSPSIKQISVKELYDLLEQDSTINLVDVRTAAEYAAARVPHIKYRVDFQEIAASIDTLKFPKDEPIYLICRSGRRSLVAAKELLEFGYRRPINIEGGTADWMQSGYLVIKTNR